MTTTSTKSRPARTVETHTGELYQPGMSTKAAAAKVRKLLKTEGYGTSVKVLNHSTSETLSITILTIPESLQMEDLFTWTPYPGQGAPYSGPQDIGVTGSFMPSADLVGPVEEIAKLFQKSESCGAEDYFSANYSISIKVDSGLKALYERFAEVSFNHQTLMAEMGLSAAND